MSKSKKLPIYKDKGVARHEDFRRKIKRATRQKVKEIMYLTDIESYELPAPKILVNDYDWCDYIFDYRFKSQNRYITDPDEFNKYIEESKIKYSRK